MAARTAAYREIEQMPAVSGRRAIGRKSSGSAKVGNNGVLAGAVIYVDAFLDDRSPMRDEYGRLLRNLGADVRARLPAKVATLTHLVWKDGDEGTAQKAEDAGVILVSPSWVHACDKGGVRAAEGDHRADFDPALYGAAAKKKARRRKPTLEPTIDEWQGVDNLDLCLSSSQRDPPELSWDSDDDALLGSSSSSCTTGRGRGGNRGSAARATRKSASRLATSSAPRKVSARGGPSLGSSAVPRSRASSRPGGGSSSGNGNAGTQGRKGRPVSGGPSSNPQSASLLSPKKAKAKTYGSGNVSRLSAESAALGKRRRVGFCGERGAPKGSRRGGLSSGKEAEGGGDSCGEAADAATEVEDEAAETGEAEDVATDVDCGRSFDNSNVIDRENLGAAAPAAAAAAAAAAGVDELSTSAADGDDQEEPEGTDLDKTITEDYACTSFSPDDAAAENKNDTNNDQRRDQEQGQDDRSPAARAPPPVAGAAADVAGRGAAASPLTPAAEAASNWTVGGRGLLGRGSGRKSGGGLSGLGSAGRVAATAGLKSPGLYAGAGLGESVGRARGNRLTRGGAEGGGGGGCAGLSSGGDSTAFDISDDDGDGDETERTVLDSTDCESKAARDRMGQAEAADEDSSPERSGAEEDSGKATDSSRKTGRRSSPRGVGAGGGGGGRRRSSPSPSPRLALSGGDAGRGGKEITTPVTRASRRGGPAGNGVVVNDTNVQTGSASRARGPAATPGSGYAADRSAGPARTTKARARTKPLPPASAGGVDAITTAAATAGGGADVGTAQGAQQSGSAAAVGGGGAAAVPEEREGWSCGMCTLLNGTKDGRCNACGTARPRRPPRARATPSAAASADGSGGSGPSPPASAAKSPPEFEPSGQGEGSGGGGGAAVSAAMVDSPGGSWEGYEMLERSTASSSAKSNRASRPPAPASNRKPRSRNSRRSGSSADGGAYGADDGNLSRNASPSFSPADGAEPLLASSAKVPRLQQRQHDLRGVFQGGDEVDASPEDAGANLSPHGAYLGSSGGPPESCSTGKDNSGNDPLGENSQATAEEGDSSTAPAVRLFGVATPSPSAAPSPSIGLLPPPPPQAGSARSGGGAAAGSRETEMGGMIDGAGLRNAARGQDGGGEGGGADLDAEGADLDAEEEGEEEAETEVQGGGMVAAIADGDVCPGGEKGEGVVEEESETDTVKKSTDGGSSTKDGRSGHVPGDSEEAASVNPGGLLDHSVEDGGSSGSGSRGVVRGDASVVALAVAAEGAHAHEGLGLAAAVQPSSDVAGDLASKEAETSDSGARGGRRRASARLRRGSTGAGAAAPEDCHGRGGRDKIGSGRSSSPSLPTGGQYVAGTIEAGREQVQSVGMPVVSRRGARRRSIGAAAAKQAALDAGREGAASTATAAEALEPIEQASAANGGGRRRSARGAASSSAAAAAAAAAAAKTAPTRGPGTPSTARVAALYAMNKGPAATADSLDEVAAAARVMNLLPGAVEQTPQQEPQPPSPLPPAEGTRSNGNDEVAAATMMLIAAASREQAVAAAAAAAAEHAPAGSGSSTRKKAGRSRGGAKDSSAATARSTRGAKRSSRGHGDEADSAAGRPGRSGPANGRGSNTGFAKRRKQSSSAAAEESATAGGEGAVSGGAAVAAAAAPAGWASEDNAELSGDDMDLFGGEEAQSPIRRDGGGDGDVRLVSALDDSLGDEMGGGDKTSAAVVASAPAGKAVVDGATSNNRSRRSSRSSSSSSSSIGSSSSSGSSRRGKANAERGGTGPRRGSGGSGEGSGGGDGCQAPVGTRGGKGKSKAAANTANRRKPRVRGGGGSAAVAAAAAGASAAGAGAGMRATGNGKRAGGKRKRGVGVGAAAPAGKGEEGGNGQDGGGGESTVVQQGVVRVVFSGLQPDDRQAAMSVVRSLSKGHRPAGSGVCTSDADGYTHLVIPDESRRTLKVLFALCAPLSPNGRPPVVVTVSWLYASLERGFFVDSEAFRPGRYRGPQGRAAAMPPAPAAETLSISSRLLSGEKVMLAGVSDPPPEVAEGLVQATGAQMTRSLEDATLLLVESEPELEAWVQRMKNGNSGNDGRGAGSKSSALIGGGGGGGSSNSSGRKLAASTASARNAAAGGGGRSGRGPPGKRREGAGGAAGWGQEKENALEALKSAARVIRLPWLFDSVEKGVRVDNEDFLVRADGAQPQTTQESVADAVASQGW